MTSFIVAILRVKLYAIFLGPAGFGIMSQLNNFYFLFTTTIHLGVPVSVTSEISKINFGNDSDKKGKINAYFRFLTSRFFVVSFLFTAVIILFSGDITQFLVDDSFYSTYLVIIFVAAPFGVLYIIIEAFLRGFKEIGKIVKINILTNIISTILLIPLIYYLQYLGVSIYFLIFGLLPSILILYIAKKFVTGLQVNYGYSLTKQDKNLIFKIGSVSLISSLLHQGAIILIRKLIIAAYGYDDNGIYQSVLSVSLSYFSIIYLFLLNYTLSRFSECKSDELLVKEININARFLMLIMVPLMLLFYGFKEIGVLLLFSSKFLSAGELFFPQFIGDIFRVGAALFGLWLISRQKIRQLIIIDVIFNLIYLFLTFVCIKLLFLNLIYVSISYAFAFFCHFAMYFMYTRHSIGFKFEKKILLTFIYSIFAFILTYTASFFNKYIGFSSTIIILLIWFYLVVERYEIRQFKELILLNLEKRRNIEK